MDMIPNNHTYIHTCILVHPVFLSFHAALTALKLDETAVERDDGLEQKIELIGSSICMHHQPQPHLQIQLVADPI